MIIHVSHVGSRLYICGILYIFAQTSHVKHPSTPQGLPRHQLRNLWVVSTVKVQKTAIPKNGPIVSVPREPQHTPGIPNSLKRRELQIINCLLGGVCWGRFGMFQGYVGKLLGDDIQPPHPKSYDHLKERLPKWDNYTVQAGADCELLGCLLEYNPPQLQWHFVDIPGWIMIMAF